MRAWGEVVADSGADLRPRVLRSDGRPLQDTGASARTTSGEVLDEKLDTLSQYVGGRDVARSPVDRAHEDVCYVPRSEHGLRVLQQQPFPLRGAGGVDA